MIDFFYEFKNKVLLNEEETPIETESDMEKILSQSKKVTSVLTQLLTTQKSPNKEALDQIREVVTDIKCISYKPTTFRIAIRDGAYFDLKYNPTPLQIKYPEEYQLKDAFSVTVSGRKYNIAGRSDFEQCLDAINKIMRERPVQQEPNEGGEEEPAEDQEAPDEQSKETGDES